MCKVCGVDTKNDFKDRWEYYCNICIRADGILFDIDDVLKMNRLEEKQSNTISVIIPLFYGQQYVHRLVRMLEKNQKNLSSNTIEVVFVDDSPISDLLNIDFTTTLNVKYLINHYHHGIHSSRIYGLVNSSSEYILFLDQDDLICPNCLIEHLQYIDGYDASISGLYYNNCVFYDVYPERFAGITDINFYRKAINPIVTPGQVLIRRASIPIEWIDNSLSCDGSDDWLMWVLMFENGKRFNYFGKVLISHYFSGFNRSLKYSLMKSSMRESIGILMGISIWNPEIAIDAWGNYCDEHWYLKSGDEKNNMPDRYQLLDEWFGLYQDGYRVESFFKFLGVYHIAIYGMGLLGKHLIKELANSEIAVDCYFDKNACNIHYNKKIIGEKIDSSVQMIVVTPLSDFYGIYEELKQHYTQQIVSIAEIIFNLVSITEWG